jgi:hypothetical protein
VGVRWFSWQFIRINIISGPFRENTKTEQGITKIIIVSKTRTDSD